MSLRTQLMPSLSKQLPVALASTRAATITDRPAPTGPVAARRATTLPVSQRWTRDNDDDGPRCRHTKSREPRGAEPATRVSCPRVICAHAQSAETGI